MQCAFTFRAWRASSTCLAQPEQWQAWARGDLFVETLPIHKPDVAFLPAMQRRRLGVAARLLFDAAYPLLQDETCPMVFASRDGELNRSFELWLSLLREQSVSPTSFGLSVHNALAGQWTLLRGEMSENTALSVREAVLETAFVEAVAMLAEGLPRVLVVVAEEPLSAECDVLGVSRAPFAHAVAFVLERGDEWQLSFTPHSRQPEQTDFYWGALTWVQHVLQGQTQFVHSYSTGAWTWTKSHSPNG